MSLSNQQYDAIMQEYEASRTKNRDLQEARKDQVYSKIPRLEEIDSKVAELSTTAVKNLLESDIDNIDSVSGQIQKLLEEKRLLIAGSGFPADYLEPIFDCPDCKDTGYVNNSPCHCFRQRELNILYNQSNLQGILKDCDINSFSLDYYSDRMVDSEKKVTEKDFARKALNASKDFISKFRENGSSESILYYGPTGTGKTFLSSCVAREVMNAGHSVIYFSAIKLFDILRDHQFEHDDKDSSYNRIFSSDLLIIDDLGTENLTGFTLSQLFNCINERLLRNKSTIISTNLTLEEFRDHYTERIMSRIFSSYNLLKLYGDDIRLRLKIK